MIISPLLLQIPIVLFLFFSLWTNDERGVLKQRQGLFLSLTLSIVLLLLSYGANIEVYLLLFFYFFWELRLLQRKEPLSAIQASSYAALYLIGINLLLNPEAYRWVLLALPLLIATSIAKLGASKNIVAAKKEIKVNIFIFTTIALTIFVVMGDSAFNKLNEIGPNYGGYIFCFYLIYLFLFIYPKGESIGREGMKLDLVLLATFSILLAHLMVETKVFEYSQNTNEHTMNWLRWVTLFLAIASGSLLLKLYEESKHLAIHLYFCLSILILLYSWSNDISLIWYSTLIYLIALLFAQSLGGLIAKRDRSCENQMVWIYSLVACLPPLNMAAIHLLKNMAEKNMEWFFDNKIFFFPPILLLFGFIACLLSAIIILNDLFDLNTVSNEAIKPRLLKISACTIILVPFIFLGIYTSPLYNYIQKYILP